MSVLTALAPPAVRGEFARRLLRIALPITLQTVVFSSKGIVDAVMLGSQDEASVAAIGVASRATFVVTIFLVGLSTGAAQIGAQVWGSGAAGRAVRLRQTVWLGWAASSTCGLLAFAAFFWFPEQVVATSTSSPEVIERGAEFLRIVSFTFLLFPYTSSLAAGLRVMHQPTTSMIYALVGVGLNVVLNSVLIFGLLGAPAMGIAGAAWGTLLSAIVETGLLWAHLRSREHPLARFPRTELRAIRRDEAGLLLRLSLPAALNSTLWALGVFVFSAIVGGASLETVTALAVLSPVESLSLAFTLGLANAAAVLVGGTLGAGRTDDAYAQAVGLVRLGVLVGAITGLGVWALRAPVLALFPTLTPSSYDLTSTFYTLMAASFVLKSVSMILVLGVLRAGGEARFCLLLDVTAQWVVLLPLAALLRFVVGVDPVWLYGLLLVEEAVRITLAGRRVRSRRWLRTLVA